MIMAMAKPVTKVTFVRLPLDYYREAAALAKKETRPSVANMLTALVKEAIDARKSLSPGGVA
jgi:hypothetical protein